MFSSLTHQNSVSLIYGENRGERVVALMHMTELSSPFYFAFLGEGLACHSLSTFFLGCGYAGFFFFFLGVWAWYKFCSSYLFIYLLDLTKCGFFYMIFLNKFRLLLFFLSFFGCLSLFCFNWKLFFNKGIWVN